MQKKLKGWQIALLIIIYPAGIVYLILKYLNKKKESADISVFDVSKAEIERDFHTKVVGVTFKNDNGSDRQKILKSCKDGDDIIFKPTPSKQYPDAIGVFNTKGKQLGNVNADLALELKKKYPNNPMKVTISNITGGRDGLNYGCNLHVIIYKKQ